MSVSISNEDIQFALALAVYLAAMWKAPSAWHGLALTALVCTILAAT